VGARLVLESFHGARILGSFAGALPKALQRLGLPEILAYQQILVIFSAVGAVYLILFSLLKEVKPKLRSVESALLSEQELGERKLLMKWSDRPRPDRLLL